MDEYKDIKNINVRKIEDIHIYQVQSKEEQNKIRIVKVGYGYYKDKPKILINEFKWNSYKCLLISCLYREEDIDLNNNLDMVQLRINKEVDNKLELISYLNFYCKVNKDIKYELGEEKELECKYGINLNYKDNSINLNKYNKYPGQIKMIDLLIECLSNSKVLNLFNM